MTADPNEPTEQIDSESSQDDFARLAQQDDPGLVREFVDFLRYNKKWWMTPIIVITLLLSLLAFLAATPAAPFIYSFF